MSLLNKLTEYFTRRTKKKFEDLNDGVLAVLGILSFLVSGYIRLFLGEVTGSFVKLVSAHGVSSQALAFSFILGALGLFFWFFFCIAARCHTLIYDRWFK